LTSDPPAAASRDSTPGTLYLVATPIGNLEDITLRALRTLRSVRWIAAENPPRTRLLLAHYAVATEIFAYRPGRNADTSERIFSALRQGEDVAFVCDAGMPGIADPGGELARRAWKEGIPVCALPGATAFLLALVTSGFATGRFAFEGAPPRSRADRNAFFARLALESRTLLLQESAAYLTATLGELALSLGPDRRVCVACDLTKPGESFWRGTLEEARAHFRQHRPRGQYVLVVRNAPTA
jgi:16S rRNA (cytidine1402-2'-O)-methyltransferase